MEFVDDGLYNNQWNIYDIRGTIFCQVFTQGAAEEIFFAVNYMRGRLSAIEENEARALNLETENDGRPIE